MKKIIAALLALTLVMSASVTAFGANQKEVKTVMDSACDYIIGEYSESGFTAQSVKYFLRLVKAGADVSDYKDDFLSSAAEALANQETDGDTKIMLFETFIELGEYPESFSEQDAINYMDGCSIIGNPYIYADAIRVCLAYDLDEDAADFADALCGCFVENIGAVYWGNKDYMSGDDNAMFIYALAPLAEDYSDKIESATAILEGYYSEDGYTSYGEANTDTTALALAAYSAIGDKEKADEIYDMLVDNFFNDETGGFVASYDAVYATADAIFGLAEYMNIADELLTGWHCIDGVWRYFREDGTTRKGWAKDGNKWYYTDSEGVAMKGWIKDNNKWYYLDNNGIMQTGLQQIGKNWYFFNGDGAMRTGWQKTANNWYYFNSSGAMQTGWVKDGGKWYFLSNSGTISTGYGTMKTGWVKDGGKWYFLDKSGAMKTGWVKDGGKWYFLDKSGAMKTGWVKDAGKWYFLNSNGAMATGWVKDAGKWYYMDASGAMLANTSKRINGKTYKFNGSGVCLNP